MRDERALAAPPRHRRRPLLAAPPLASPGRTSGERVLLSRLRTTRAHFRWGDEGPSGRRLCRWRLRTGTRARWMGHRHLQAPWWLADVSPTEADASAVAMHCSPRLGELRDEEEEEEAGRPPLNRRRCSRPFAWALPAFCLAQRRSLASCSAVSPSSLSSPQPLGALFLRPTIRLSTALPHLPGLPLSPIPHLLQPPTRPCPPPASPYLDAIFPCDEQRPNVR